MGDEHTMMQRLSLLASLVSTLSACQAHEENAIPRTPVSLEASQWLRAALVFDDLVWHVRSGQYRAGPGNNLWGHAAPQVSLDPKGRLRLSVTADEQENLRSAEIATELPSGPCRIVVDVDSALMGLDPNVVVGVFVYRNDQSEFDFEASRWGKPEAPDGLFTVAPTVRPGPVPVTKKPHQRAFALPPGPTRIVFEWREDSVTFALYARPEEEVKPLPVAVWAYGGKGVPKLGGHRLHVNVWHRHETQDAQGIKVERAEVVIKRVQIHKL
jgi:hypothetical protein